MGFMSRESSNKAYSRGTDRRDHSAMEQVGINFGWWG